MSTLFLRKMVISSMFSFRKNSLCFFYLVERRNDKSHWI